VKWFLNEKSKKELQVTYNQDCCQAEERYSILAYLLRVIKILSVLKTTQLKS